MIRLHNGPPPEVTVEVHPATPEELAAHRDFEARCRQLHIDRHQELLAKYPDQHVALTDSWTLVVANSSAELVAKITERGDQPGESACDFMNTKPRRRLMIW